MFENKIKEAKEFITREVDKRVEKIIAEVDVRIKDETYKAYKAGYEDAVEDVCRRLENLYSVAYVTGKANGMADAGAIEIEDLDDDIAEALEEEKA